MPISIGLLGPSSHRGNLSTFFLHVPQSLFLKKRPSQPGLVTQLSLKGRKEKKASRSKLPSFQALGLFLNRP